MRFAPVTFQCCNVHTQLNHTTRGTVNKHRFNKPQCNETDFPLLQNVQTQPPVQCVPVVLSRGKSGRGLKLTQPPTAEVKNEWNHTATPPICLNGVDREILIFNFLQNE